jgi:glycosyltransferase involved in cell wall biosynthesis
MKIDVVVCTYNSEKYLDLCLKGIREVFDVNRLIVVDHHSKDATIAIAKTYDAEIYFETEGYAYALNVGISKTETPIFAIIDSDVALVNGRWVQLLFRKFDDPTIGGVGLKMFSNEPLWRQEYCAFYMRKKNFRDIRGGSWVNAYVIRKKAFGEDFHIPVSLKNANHLYMRDVILRNGFRTDSVDAGDSTHFYSEINKGFLMGEGERDYYGLKGFFQNVVRHSLLSPVKAVLPALAYGDVNVLLENTRYWFDYLKGYLKPERYKNYPKESGLV